MCVHMSGECTSDSNVSEWNYGWKPFFIYIDSYIVCLFGFFLLRYLLLWGGGHNFLHLLYSFRPSFSS